MPRLKEAEELLNVKELEEAEYDDTQFQKYNGEIAPTGTLLVFRVTKMWWTESTGEDPMLKVLCVAEDNPGDLEEYDGMPAWENMVLTAKGKFKWDPFLDHFGLTIRDVHKKTYVAEEDDNNGAPIEKIGRFVPGSDDAVFVGVVSKEKYQGKWQAHISEWLDADTEIEEPEEEEEEERPARRSRSSSRSKAAPATGRGRRKPKEEPEDEPDDEDEDEEEERPARTSRSRKAPAKSTARKPAARGRGSRKAKDDEDDDPPF